MRIIMILILCISMVGITSAQSSSNNDCNDFSNVDPSTYPTSVKEWIKGAKREDLTIFTDKDMFVALNHLKLYCCEQWDINEETCSSLQKPPERWFPESPYIVDQLMYVWMKKLDWNQEHCDILWIDCQPESYDVDPVEWRDEINEIANDVKWYPPSMIYGKFEETWWSSEQIMNQGDETLAKSYRAMCNDLWSIRASVWSNQWLVDAPVSGWKSIELLCQTRAQYRFRQEAQYIRLLQLEKWRKYFMDNLTSYLSVYFLDSRLSWLMWKYAKLDSCFATVLRYIEKTTCCNQ